MKELYTAAGIFVVLILLGVWMVQNNRNEQEKKLVQLRKKWGKKQEKRTEREKKALEYISKNVYKLERLGGR